MLSKTFNHIQRNVSIFQEKINCLLSSTIKTGKHKFLCKYHNKRTFTIKTMSHREIFIFFRTIFKFLRNRALNQHLCSEKLTIKRRSCNKRRKKPFTIMQIILIHGMFYFSYLSFYSTLSHSFTLPFK